MPRKKKTDRPKPLPFPSDPRVTVRAIRGPRGQEWYWQGTAYRGGYEITVFRGWATRAEV
ncbi:MAG: hypothetical protein JRJ84_20615, partial [Deltaproteobacteria bacterium]|nr:hypothetical protein [Deltaproteobacteria bacterium]